MDKFDQTIKDAQETHEPNGQFVNSTMQEVANQQSESKTGRGFHFWVPAAIGGIIVVVLVFVLLPSGKTNAPGMTTKPNVATTNKATNERQQSNTISTGTDNTSLASDLSNVQSAVNQEGNDQNGANSALNDQQQVIAVPTN